MAWADIFPQDFVGAVLINTSLPRISSPFYRLRPQALLSMLLSSVSFANANMREKQLLSLVSNYKHVRTKLLPSWVAIQRERRVSNTNYLRMLYSAVSFSTPDNTPFAHTLVLKSKQDRLINPRCSDQIQQLWNTSLAEHTTAGHDLTSDDPQWVVEKIDAWRKPSNKSKSTKSP